MSNTVPTEQVTHPPTTEVQHQPWCRDHFDGGGEDSWCRGKRFEVAGFSIHLTDDGKPGHPEPTIMLGGEPITFDDAALLASVLKHLTAEATPVDSALGMTSLDTIARAEGLSDSEVANLSGTTPERLQQLRDGADDAMAAELNSIASTLGSRLAERVGKVPS